MSEFVRLDTPLEPRESPAIGLSGVHGEPLVNPVPSAPANGLAPPLARKRLQVFMAMMMADVAILLGCFGAFSFAYLIAYRGLVSMDAAMLPAYLLLPIFLTIGLFNGTEGPKWHDAAAFALGLPERGYTGADYNSGAVIWPPDVVRAMLQNIEARHGGEWIAP